MRYIGSKSLTASVVCAKAGRMFGKPLDGASMCDPFGGLGTVAGIFKTKGCRVTVGDHLLFPHVYQVAKLGRASAPKFKLLRENLNLFPGDDLAEYIQNIEPSEGDFFINFAKERKFFNKPNGRKIDAIWMAICNWRNAGYLNEKEYGYLLSSLVDSFDKVANTAGTYYAYLNKFSIKAKNPFKFKFIKVVEGRYSARCILSEASATLSDNYFDIVYLDPPYSRRSYDRYYHLPQSIVQGGLDNPKGLSGVPDRAKVESKFETPALAEQAMRDLIGKINCSVLIIQYADGGLIPLSSIRQMAKDFGELRVEQIKTIGYTTKSQPRDLDHSLFLVRKK